MPLSKEAKPNLIPPSYELNRTANVLKKDAFGINYPMKVEILSNKEAKPNKFLSHVSTSHIHC